MKNKTEKLLVQYTVEEIAEDVIYNLKDDIKCLYMVSEMKKELKEVSEAKYKIWDEVHTIVLKKFGIYRKTKK